MRTLVNISNAQLRQLPLSESVVAEIIHARSMNKSARKRQIGYIAKQMADEPVEQARALLASLQQPAASANSHLHQLEQWRDKLLAGDEETMTELIDNLQADRQQLRRLVRNANNEKNKGQPPKAYRQLFQYLKQLQQQE